LEAFRYISEFAKECDKLDMPFMIEPVLMGENIPKERKKDPELITHACRIALELGADILKVPYTGDKESFSAIVNNSPVPVVILGGPRMSSMKEVLQTAKDSVDAGGKGVVFGRNVWQSPSMSSVISALQDIVHKGQAVETAMNNNGIS
jgi:DhnA family fructose-bisphosphate aldolase class Ia